MKKSFNTVIVSAIIVASIMHMPLRASIGEKVFAFAGFAGAATGTIWQAWYLAEHDNVKSSLLNLIKNRKFIKNADDYTIVTVGMVGTAFACAVCLGSLRQQDIIDEQRTKIAALKTELENSKKDHTDKLKQDLADARRAALVKQVSSKVE